MPASTTEAAVEVAGCGTGGRGVLTSGLQGGTGVPPGVDDDAPLVPAFGVVGGGGSGGGGGIASAAFSLGSN